MESVNITELPPKGLEREFQVRVHPEIIHQKTLDFVLLKGKTYKIPGFRPGKVPLDMLKKTFWKEGRQQALQDIIESSSREVIQQFNPSSPFSPEFFFDSVEDNQIFQYRLVFEGMPVVPQIDFKEFKGKHYIPLVSPEYEKNALKEFAKKQALSKPLDKQRPSKKGDILFIELNVYLKNEKDPIHSEELKIQLGQKQLHEDIEKKFTDALPGTVHEDNTKAPASINEKKISGKPLKVRLTMKDIHVPLSATVNDEFAKALNYQTVDHFKKDFLASLEEKGKELSFLRLKKDIFDYLFHQYPLEVSTKMIQKDFQGVWQEVLRQSGVQDSTHPVGSPERKKALRSFSGKTEEDLQQQYRDISKRRVTLGVILDELAKHYNVSLSDEEIEGLVAAQIQNDPHNASRIRLSYRNNPQLLENLKTPALEKKIIEHLISHHLTLESEEIDLAELEDQVAHFYDETPAYKTKEASDAASEATQNTPPQEGLSPTKKKSRV